ncbi:trypsin-like peptidase domain-containing protein [Streptomyces prunicolor]|uniref:trypsin-like serine peptidase n=1 Tax=Streptomyces prunicolor TaxID=67348 RepID=UPI003864BDB5|nr:trypsin-like peptidase domain-containing protein [Streptomyces prunicolor]
MSHQSPATRSDPLIRLGRGRAALVAVCLAVVAAVGSSGPAVGADRAATEHRAIVDVPGSRSTSEQARQSALLAYWTPERIGKALTNEAAGDSRSLPRAQAAPVDGPHSTAVGKLVFEHANGKPDACTGTVINSDSEVLVLTAAHCLHDGPGLDWTKNQVFYPGFHDGSAPYGGFTAWNIATSPAWSIGSKPDYEHDYGMLVVNDNASGETVLDAAGGYQIAPDMRTGEQVSLIGYSGPPYDGNHQEFCQDLVEPTVPPVNMWQVECPNMTPGSSGGPWLLDYDYDTGTGYIGGLNSINDTGNFMASPRFDNDMKTFYALMEQIGEARP